MEHLGTPSDRQRSHRVVSWTVCETTLPYCAALGWKPVSEIVSGTTLRPGYDHLDDWPHAVADEAKTDDPPRERDHVGHDTRCMTFGSRSNASSDARSAAHRRDAADHFGPAHRTLRYHGSYASQGSPRGQELSATLIAPSGLTREDAVLNSSHLAGGPRRAGCQPRMRKVVSRALARVRRQRTKSPLEPAGDSIPGRSIGAASPRLPSLE